MARSGSASVLFLAPLGATLEGFVAPVSRALRPYGLRPVAVAGRGSVPPSLHRSFDAVHEVAPFRRAGLRNLARAGRDLARIVREERVDLLHLHTPYAVAVGRVVARVTRTPHVAVVHGTLFGAPGRAGQLFSVIETVSARLTPTYVTLNPDDQEIYRRLAPRSRVHYAPCGGAGVDAERLRASGPGEPVGEGRPPRVVVMGRLTPDKNFDLAVSAWRVARRSLPDLELRIVGSTSIGEPAWVPPDEPGISAVGWTPEPGVELAAADVVLSTSPREGFGLTVAEALVMGKPVVAVDNRGTRGIAEKVAEGLILVPPRAASISSALLSQLRARTVRIGPGVLESWRQENVVAFHASVILDALARSTGGGRREGRGGAVAAPAETVAAG